MVESVTRLARRFAKLPGIGPKTANRLAYFVLKLPEEEVLGFAKDLIDSRQTITYCEICGNMMDASGCAICSDHKRDTGTVCVVADVKDLLAVERTHEYNGVFHVLNGTISPLDGINPEDLRINQLLLRIKNDDIKEIILATNPDVPGEATAAYLAKLVKPFGLKVSRIAHGMPVGGDIEFTDENTLLMAIENRREY